MREPNRKLAARMAELRSRLINAEIGVLTGKPGNVTDADVRRWLRGETKWPQDRIRLGLEKVLSVSAVDLGFVPRRKHPVFPEEDPTRRRTLLNAAGGAALAVGVPDAAVPRRLGINDVRRFHQDYVAILRDDDAGRGPKRVENLAVELASRIQSALAQSTASARVQGMLHRLVAEVSCSAAFASLDAKTPQRARAHLDRALIFAGLSRDSEAAFHVWNHMFLTSSMRENHPEAVAGAEVMKRSSIARRDPLYASLGHLRNANALARVPARRSDALRALNDAERAFARATDRERPEWIRFYDSSEFDALSAFVWVALGEYERSEYCLHRTLASIPREKIRDRALYTAHLSLVQARQGDVELAGATGRQAYVTLPSTSEQGRVIRTLAATRKVLVSSGSKVSEVVNWIEESAEWI
ncbi:XRE family transcriptional regulator [Streptomyces sp. LP11]|uniref:XRE family transcriptional regulator n=1 Tax=Streptomyces pyxinicus TaxID=2970331 RepID=A0ABT2AYE7_9ACTN|nr:XRE family transcriptional regulator [Streptomyces sp. LP11]MCS0601282.1 XRE family transcriptional regulator [Streptomyces sp. LP11]